MFLISGLFVYGSLIRRGAADFLRARAWRLGIPYLVSVFLLMPMRRRMAEGDTKTVTAAVRMA